MLTVVLPVYHTETLTLPVEADAIELRLDYCERLTVPAIIALRSKISVPVIFTLRKVSQGGLYIGSETDRINTLLELSQAAPDYIDIEHDVDPAFIRQLHHQYPHIKLICSYHNFEHTPDDLMSIL